MAWERLATDLGLLLAVRGIPEGSRLEVMDFEFERRRLRLACDVDTDEVVVEAAGERLAESVDLGHDERFADLIGKRLDLAWVLTNHRGY